MSTMPKSLNGFDNAIKLLETRMKSASATPEYKALAKKRIARLKEASATLESKAYKEYRSRLVRGKIAKGDTATYQLGLKIKNRSVSYADLTMYNEPSAFQRGMQNFEEKFGGDNLLTTVKGAMAIAILDVLGADILAKSVVTGLVQSGALANLLPTLVTFALSNPVAAVVLVAVAYLGVKKLFGPIVKKMQARLDLNMDLDTMDLENAEGDFSVDKSLEDNFEDFERENNVKKGDGKGKDKGDNEIELDDEEEIELDDEEEIELDDEEEIELEGDSHGAGGRGPGGRRNPEAEPEKKPTEPPKPETPKHKLARLEGEIEKASRKARSAYLDTKLAESVESKAQHNYDLAEEACKKDPSRKNILKYNMAKSDLEHAQADNKNAKIVYEETIAALDDKISEYALELKALFPDLNAGAKAQEIRNKCNIEKATLGETVSTWAAETLKKGAKKGAAFANFVKNTAKAFLTHGAAIANDFQQSMQQLRKERTARSNSKTNFQEFINEEVSPIFKEKAEIDFTPLDVEAVSRMDSDEITTKIQSLEEPKNTSEQKLQDCNQTYNEHLKELEELLYELEKLKLDETNLVNTAESGTEGLVPANPSVLETLKSELIKQKTTAIETLKAQIKKDAQALHKANALVKAIEKQISTLEQEQKNRERENRRKGEDPANMTKKEATAFVDKYKNDRVGIVIDIIAKNDHTLRTALHDVKKDIPFADSEAFKKLSAEDQKKLKNASITGPYAIRQKPRQVSNSEEFNAKSPAEQIEACKADYNAAFGEFSLLKNKLDGLLEEIKSTQENYEALLYDYAIKKGFEDVSNLEENIIALACRITKLKDKENFMKTSIKKLENEMEVLKDTETNLRVNAVNEENLTTLEDEGETKIPVSKEDIASGFGSVKDAIDKKPKKTTMDAANTAYSRFIGSFNTFVETMQSMESGSKDINLQNNALSCLKNMETAIQNLDSKKAMQSHPCKESLKVLFNKLFEFAQELQKTLETKVAGTKTVSVKDKLAEVGLNSKGRGKQPPTKLTGALEDDLKKLLETEKS